MSTNDDTTPADDAADTLANDEGQDTLQADDAQDTTTAGDGQDTLEGDAGGNAGGSEPAKPASAPRTTTVKVETDDLDREFDEAIKAVNDDEMMTPGQKAAERVRLKADRENRTRQRTRDAHDEENDVRNAEAAKLGVSREVFDNAWAKACKESEKELGRFSHDAARLLLKQNITAAKKDPAPSPSAKPRSQAAPKIDKGARLSPPGGSGGRITKPQLSAEEQFDQGDWSLPN